MDTFAALIPDSAQSGPPPIKEKHVPPPQFDRRLNKNTKTLTLVMDYANPSAMLKLAQVSRQLRALASHDEYWQPYLDKIGVDPAKTAEPSMLDTTTPLTVLDAGYCGSAYATMTRILRNLGPYYLHPQTVKRDFPILADQARVLLLVQRLACLDEDSPHLKAARLAEIQATIESSRETALLQFGQKLDACDYQAAKPLVDLLIVSGDQDALLQYYLSRSTLPASQSSLLQISEVKEPPVDILRTRSSEVVKFLNAKAVEIDACFGTGLPVYRQLLEKILDNDMMEFVNGLFIEEKEKSLEDYFSFVPQAYEILDKAFDHLEPSSNAQGDVKAIASTVLQSSMETDIEAFLDQQSDAFRTLANDKVAKWAQDIAEQEHEFEQITLKSVPGSQEKSNFLRSFKKALALGGDSEDKTEEGGITEFEAQAKIMDSKLKGIETLFSLELTLSIIAVARSAIRRARPFARLPGKVGQSAKTRAEALFVDLVGIVGDKHIHLGFQSALNTLNQYDPKKYGRLVALTEDSDGESERAMTVEPLAIFAELVNIGDLIQQTVHVFFEQELAAPKLVDRNDFVAPSVNAKRRFEQMLDTWVADGLSRGIDVLIEQIDFVLMTVQLASDFNPLPGSPPEIGATEAAKQVISLVRSHVYLLVGSTDKSLLDVFQQEVGLRLYHSLCKHTKRQTISQEGAIRLIADMNYYYDFIVSLRQSQLYPYYEALKQVSQLFLIDSADGRQLGVAISDMSRFNSVLTSDELIEFVRRRRDWPIVKPKVEKVLYGFGECIIS